MEPADELAVRALVARYADAVTRRDADAWIATWAEVCRWDLGRGRVVTGREDVLALWLSALTRYPWVAQVAANGLVEGGPDADHATGSWYLVELNHREDGSGVLHLVHYFDTYARTAAGWRFAERRLHVVYRGRMDAGVVVPMPTAPGGLRRARRLG